MNPIAWVGNTEFWKKRQSTDPKFAMALCEEAVLETAFSPVYRGLLRLSKDAAIACTDRTVLRARLPAQLSPRYSIIGFPSTDGRFVVKNVASCAGSGVHVFGPTQYTEALNHWTDRMHNEIVIEEFLEGPQYQLDGFVLNNTPYFFNTLHQIWRDNKIEQYIRDNFGLIGLRRAAEHAIKAVGLNNSPFCIEFRAGTDELWKVIDMHARLGEDFGLPEIMADRYPLDIIEGAAS